MTKWITPKSLSTKRQLLCLFGWTPDVLQVHCPLNIMIWMDVVLTTDLASSQPSLPRPQPITTKKTTLKDFTGLGKLYSRLTTTPVPTAPALLGVANLLWDTWSASMVTITTAMERT